MDFNEILHFWFTESGPENWWKKSESFDALIRSRFLDIYEHATAAELWSWRDQPHGRLAEIIVLDQFPRNMFRGSPRSFAADPLALVLAQEAVRAGADMKLSIEQRPFLYMPYMHSESLNVHEEAMRLFSGEGMASNFDFEKKHQQIIQRFGRYPHRNPILGRESTPEEEAFLKEPGSRF